MGGGRQRRARWLLLIFGVVFVALSGIVVAPALSGESQQPQPVEAEITGPAAGPQTSAQQPFTSPQITTPQHFNVAGLRLSTPEASGIQLRVHEAGGNWSGWQAVSSQSQSPDSQTGETQPATVSDPVWAQEGDAIQYRLSGPASQVRIHLVNTTGTATSGDRLKTAVAGTVHAAVTTVTGLFTGPGASAATGAPAMVGRATWDAHNACLPRKSPQYGSTQLAIVHNTPLGSYTRSQAQRAVLGICLYDRNSNGWNDIGFNFLVDQYGTVYEGRAGGIDRSVVGAHTQGFNSVSTGISNLSASQSKPVSQAAMNSMASLIRWKFGVDGVPTSGPVTVVSKGGPVAPTRYAKPGAAASLQRVTAYCEITSGCPSGYDVSAQVAQLRSLLAANSSTVALRPTTVKPPPPATQPPKPTTTHTTSTPTTTTKKTTTTTTTTRTTPKPPPPPPPPPKPVVKKTVKPPPPPPPPKKVSPASAMRTLTSMTPAPSAILGAIRQCESSNNYRAVNPMSGAGGAYQILPSTWRQFGGTGLPQNASPAQQDLIAERIFRAQGTRPWVCGSRIG